MENWMIWLFVVISLYICHLFKTFTYFKRHKVIHAPYIPIIGSMMPVILRQLSFAEFTQKLYNFNPDAKYFGFYFTTQPLILLRDPGLIKEIFVKNYDMFLNRRGFTDAHDELIANNLFSLQGQKWKDMRSLLTPAFTSNKMKIMFTLITECAANVGEFLSDASVNKSDVNIKDIFAKYTNDVIATCAFGLKMDSLRNPTNEFYVYGQETTNLREAQAIKFIICFRLPTLARILGLKMVKNHAKNFFKKIVKDTIAVREAEKITRPDMIQLLMDIKSKHENANKLNIDDMTAQMFVFYFGGFETSSTIMSFAAHEIATNPDVQEKLRQEIDEVLEQSNGEVTYDVINQLKYLDMVIHEVLRLYPPVAFIERTCEEDYELPPALPNEKPFTVKKGQIVWVPVYAIHRDERYFENPKQFCPERFSNKKECYNSSYYIPFGLGPRMCIASRFAMLEIKVLLFHILARCELKSCARTTSQMKWSKRTLFMEPENGFWLNIRRRGNLHPAFTSMLNDGITNSQSFEYETVRN